MQMNRQYHEIAKNLPNCRVISSEGLTLMEDNLHFDAKSLRRFGIRYFDAYRELVAVGKKIDF